MRPVLGKKRPFSGQIDYFYKKYKSPELIAKLSARRRRDKLTASNGKDFVNRVLTDMSAINEASVTKLSRCEELTDSEKTALCSAVLEFKSWLLDSCKKMFETKDFVFIHLIAEAVAGANAESRRVVRDELTSHFYEAPTECPVCGASDIAVVDNVILCHSCGRRSALKLNGNGEAFRAALESAYTVAERELKDISKRLEEHDKKNSEEHREQNKKLDWIIKFLTGDRADLKQDSGKKSHRLPILIISVLALAVVAIGALFLASLLAPRTISGDGVTVRVDNSDFDALEKLSLELGASEIAEGTTSYKVVANILAKENVEDFKIYDLHLKRGGDVWNFDTSYVTSNLSFTSSYTPNEYTVTYVYGDSTKTQTVTYDEHTTLLRPSRTGYTLSPWVDADGNEVTDGRWTTASDVTLLAQWEPVTYTVHYDPNGGTGSTPDTEHTYDLSAALGESSLTRVGYTHSGWNTKPDGSGASYTVGEAVSGSSLVMNGDGGCVNPPEEDTTLFAWVYPKQYTLTLNTNTQSKIALDLTNENYTSTLSVYYNETPGNIIMPESRYYTASEYTDEHGLCYFDKNGVSDVIFDRGENVTLSCGWVRSFEDYVYVSDAEGMLGINGDGKYLIIRDIDMLGTRWSPIESFSGELDGDGHCIYNFSVNASGTGTASLGLVVSNSGAIKNLTVGKLGVSTFDSKYSVTEITITAGSEEFALRTAPPSLKAQSRTVPSPLSSWATASGSWAMIINRIRGAHWAVSAPSSLTAVSAFAA